MLIAFDCRIIRDKNPAGISRVVLEFLKKLLSTDRKNDYILIFDNLEIKDFVSNYLRHIKKKVKILIVPFGIISFGDVFRLPKILEKQKIDIYYLPYYMTSPFHGRKYKVIITVFDLIHFFYPKLKMNFIRKIYHRIILGQKMVFRRADKIITISVNTSRDLIKTFKVPPRKIKMIYMGVSDSFRVIDGAKTKKLMKEKFKVSQNYILYVGRNEPHKNIKALIIAYARLPENIQQNYDLVLVGKEDEKYNQTIRLLIAKYGIESNVIFTGYVEESDLPYIYSGASVFVFPSFYEGFGLPILEAMACGVPVVCSNTSSLPEVGGDAALYSDPTDIHKMSENIRSLLEDSILREEMIRRGLRQVKNFTWFNAANNLSECFNEIGVEKNNV
jgi:glycosyltransferase involved in cell wall biosynthesis